MACTYKYPKSFPNQEEEYFLRMLLCAKKDFLPLWQAWKERIVFEHLDKSIAKLVPYLYLRLKEAQISDEQSKKIRGVYKYTWYRNLLVMDAAGKALSSLHQDDIPALLLKGIPLLLKAYKNTGACSVGDADILVDPRHLERSVEIMLANGWQYVYPSVFSMNRFLKPWDNKYNHGITFLNRHNVQIVLHWSLFQFLFDEDKEHPMTGEEVFQHAIALNFQGVQGRMPCPEDMIIHVIVHGPKPTFPRNLGWVLDVATILRNLPVDWEFLMRRIKKFDVAIELKVALSYLRNNYSLPIPESFFHELSRWPMENNKIKRYYRNSNRTELMVFGPLFCLGRGYRLHHRKGHILTGWYHFLDHVCRRLGIARKRQIPVSLWDRYKRRIMEMVQGRQ